jgi:ABC-2 type transport system permease protein
MNLRAIGALVHKDFSLFFRNRFFAVVTVLGIVAYLAIYFVMPSSVDESLEIGLYAPVVPPVFEQVEGEGLEVELVGSEDALRQGVTDGQYVAGVVLPADIMEKLASGEKPQVDLYFTSDTPDEVKHAVEVVITELSFAQVGQPLAIELSEEILGPDMLGMQIPPRDRLRPLFAIFLIVTETFGLATLISEEVERRTAQALLVTPVTVGDLFAAKGITGTSMAFSQAVLFMAIVGGTGGQPSIILVALLLGAVLVTGVGFLMASLAKDMMSVMAWGVVAFILLLIPSISVLLPGTLSGWVEIIPSHYLVDTVHKVANFGLGWADIWRNLLVLLGFDVVIMWFGIIALRRKLQ